MRHYEIVLIIHPDQSDQAPTMVKKYKTMVKEGGGDVHRFEDWGRRQLAYPIDKIHKGHYLIFNIECGKETIEELKTAFRYNDAVIRNLIVLRDSPVTEPSPMMVEANQKRSREAEVKQAEVADDEI